jgi:hypothetical protein
MAQNTLTNLIPSLYAAMDIVSRELVGAIPCATLSADVARAAVGQTVYSFNSSAASATDITPGVTSPDDGEQVFGNTPMTITKARRVPFRWNGEQQKALNNGGPGYAALRNSQMVQAMRTLTNEIELDTVKAAVLASSRAYGVAGTTPFGSGVGDSAQLRKILDDNGAPLGSRVAIIDTSAGANLRTNTQLTKANEAGGVMTLRDGELVDLHGISYHESAAVSQVAKGTGSGYTSNAAGYAVGATDITLITGTGTVLVGDIVTFAGDTNQYVVAAGIAAPGTISLAAPGLRKAIPTSATALTVAASSVRNVAFHQSSLILATRAPALPEEGDSAIDRMVITDPRSGISFEVSMYPQYRQMMYEVAVAWGVKGIKPAHSAILLG